MSDCIIWPGRLTSAGYGRLPDGRYIHRALYAGLFPEDKQLDHLCHNHACINWAHLEAVTPEENYKRIGDRRYMQTACRAGHSWDTYGKLRANPDGKLWRRCMACQRKYDRAYRERQRGY